MMEFGHFMTDWLMRSIRSTWASLSSTFVNIANSLVVTLTAGYFSMIRVTFNLINVFRPRTSVSTPTNPLLLLSARNAARKIREREITSESLVAAYIARIEEVNPLINALVEDGFDAALALAKEIDARLDGASKIEIEKIAREQPLLGVPISIKECIEITGYKCTIGILAREDIISTTTAPTVTRLLDAGCVLLGKTNNPEVCLSFYTTNQIYGTTRNPYDTRRIPGGSSGGEGALISAAGSVIGVGSDIAGSVRFPAHFCGLFGLKTSVGVVDGEGHLPVISEFRSQMLSLGPLCRYAEDLEPMTRIMAGPKAEKLRLGQALDESSIKLFYLTGLGDWKVEPCCPETLSALDQAVFALEDRFRIKAEELKFPCTQHTVELIAASMHSDTQDPVKRILTGNGTDINPFVELARFFTGKKQFTFPSLFVSALEELDLIKEPERNKLHEERDALAAELREILGENGFLICPSYPTAAPYHVQPTFTMFNFALSGLFNIMRLPAVQCPVTMSKEGMPIGMQIVGPEYSDGALIKLAEEMEILFGGWKPMGQQ